MGRCWLWIGVPPPAWAPWLHRPSCLAWRRLGVAVTTSAVGYSVGSAVGNSVGALVGIAVETAIAVSVGSKATTGCVVAIIPIGASVEVGNASTVRVALTVPGARVAAFFAIRFVALGATAGMAACAITTDVAVSTDGATAVVRAWTSVDSPNGKPRVHHSAPARSSTRTAMAGPTSACVCGLCLAAPGDALRSARLAAPSASSMPSSNTTTVASSRPPVSLIALISAWAAWDTVPEPSRRAICFWVSASHAPSVHSNSRSLARQS